MSISDSDYKRFSLLLEQQSGIFLGENKQYLVSSRLSQFIEDSELDSWNGLVNELEKTSNGFLMQQVVDLMVTNETLWFRDSYPFQFMSNRLIPELKKARSQMRVWCAACSSGQEAYSLAMLFDEASVLGKSEVIATDLSSRMLKKAALGIYQQLELKRGMSEEKLARHFSKLTDGSWQVNQQLRNIINYKALNLLSVPYSEGKFDIIFCRNVLIYFSQENKIRVLSGMIDSLKPGGYLFLGASESLPREMTSLQMVHCNPGLTYQKI